jgi:hypothetical protein
VVLKDDCEMRPEKELNKLYLMQGDTFYANDMLMKCPSKYNEVNPDQFSN